MTFRKCGSTCMFFKSISRVIRHMKWSRIEPVSRIFGNGDKVITHFADGRY